MKSRFDQLPADELSILKERARSLAKLQTDDRKEDQVDVLEIQSRGQSFALPLMAVEGIAELSSIAAVPRAPPQIRGLVSFRGEVMVAVELSMLLGADRGGMADLRRIVAVAGDGARLVLLAERVLAVRAATMANFHRDPLSPHPFVIGADENFVCMLDPAALVAFVMQILKGPRG